MKTPAARPVVCEPAQTNRISHEADGVSPQSTQRTQRKIKKRRVKILLLYQFISAISALSAVKSDAFNPYKLQRLIHVAIIHFFRVLRAIVAHSVLSVDKWASKNTAPRGRGAVRVSWIAQGPRGSAGHLPKPQMLGGCLAEASGPSTRRWLDRRERNRLPLGLLKRFGKRTRQTSRRPRAIFNCHASILPHNATSTNHLRGQNARRAFGFDELGPSGGTGVTQYKNCDIGVITAGCHPRL